LNFFKKNLTKIVKITIVPLNCGKQPL